MQRVFCSSTVRLVALLALLLPAATGCSSLYRHTVESDDFTLYGNDDRERLQRLADIVDATIQEYTELFQLGDRRLPPPRVVYEEDDLSRSGIYTAEVRQEGFYLPLLHLVHLSPRHYSELKDGLQDAERVIRHELAHHFLIQLHPSSRSCYWLNEGVACALEAPVVVPKSGGAPIAPLYHQWLHEQAHLAFTQASRAEFTHTLEELLDTGWFGFHQSGSKVQNYALAWAFTYFQLLSIPGDFARRVQVLVDRETHELEVQIPAFLKWLAEDPNEELNRLASQPELRLWTLETWLGLTRIDGPKFLRHLLPVLGERDDGAAQDAGDRALALKLLAKLLNRPIIGSLSRERTIALREFVAQELGRGNPAEQRAIAETVRSSGYSSGYLRPLIGLLESPDPTLRVEAARALARLSDKPTITRPSFWRDGSVVERDREVGEWQRWLDRRNR